MPMAVRMVVGTAKKRRGVVRNGEWLQRRVYIARYSLFLERVTRQDRTRAATVRERLVLCGTGFRAVPQTAS